MALDLQNCLQGRRVRARPSHAWYRIRKYLQRNRWSVALGGISIVALLATSATAFWQVHQARIETQSAQAMQNFVVRLFDFAGNLPNRDFDVRRLLDAGEVWGCHELAKRPLAQAERDGVIARLRIGLGDYRDALNLLENSNGRWTRRVACPLDCIWRR